MMKSLSITTGPAILMIILILSTGAPGMHIEDDVPIGNDPVLARVNFMDQADLNQLAESFDIWEVDHVQSYAVIYLEPKEYLELISRGYQVIIDQEMTSQIQGKTELLPGQTEGIPGFPCYRTVEETYASLEDLAPTYPDLADWIDIGDSWQKSVSSGAGGYDIQTLVLTNKNHPGPKPRFYLMAAIHAREYATAELAARFGGYLLENYGQDADITWLLDY